MSAPAVSVVIRNRNEAEHLELVLRALQQQTIQPEIVVVDNESTDDSRAVIERYGARLVRLPAHDFTYGRALNLGLMFTTAPVAVILSAHALPLGKHFLADAIEPFADERVAAARLVYAGKAADVRYSLEPRRLTAGDDWRSRGPLASGCAIRRSVWEEFRFDEEPAATEEKLWARDVLEAGWTIYSAAPAAYAYLRRLTALEQLRKTDRERAEMYRAIGHRARNAPHSRGEAWRRFLRGAVVEPPRAAWAALRLQVVRAYLDLTFERRAAERPEPGAFR